MEAEKKLFTRQEIYDLVWSKSISSLFQEYAYSSRGFRKFLKQHQIPLPPSRYFTRPKDSEEARPPLPEGPETKIALTLRKKEPFLNVCPNGGNGKRDPFPHPDEFFKHRRRKPKMHRKEEAAGTLPFNPTALKNNSNLLTSNITGPSVPRALGFWDQLYGALEQKGHQLSLRQEIRILIFGQELTVKCSEQLRRIKRESEEINPSLEGTGILKLKVKGPTAQINYKDGRKKTLEEQLPELVEAMETLAMEEKKKLPLSKYPPENGHEDSPGQEKTHHPDPSNGRVLFEKAVRWQHTQYLFSYIDSMEEQAKTKDGLDWEKRKWIAWARKKTAHQDPFKNDNIPGDPLRQKSPFGKGEY